MSEGFFLHSVSQSMNRSRAFEVDGLLDLPAASTVLRDVLIAGHCAVVHTVLVAPCETVRECRYVQLRHVVGVEAPVNACRVLLLRGPHMSSVD